MPLWDDSPLKLPKLPIVTWGLIVANVVVFAFTAAAPPDMQPAILNFAVTPANITAAPIDPTPIPPDLTLVSYMFLHANLWHLLGNMIFLWVFGDDIEEAMGPLRFMGFYLASGVVAALIFVASAPHSQQPLVGASGAIAGVLVTAPLIRALGVGTAIGLSGLASGAAFMCFTLAAWLPALPLSLIHI